jgi:amidohydrolase
METDLVDLVDRHAELRFVRRVRRAIHRRPELGHQEHRTANYVERILRLLGHQPFRPAPTSVAVVIGPAGEPLAAAFRADLDAIAVTEGTQVSYASRNPGVMHACGHDAHTAILLALARRLTRETPACPVLLIFQQAEEPYPSGAPLIIAGLPAAMTPAEIFACHVWPELPENTVGVRAGTVMASVAGLAIEVRGRPGEASGTAADSGGIDAVAAAIELYRRLAPGTGRQLGPDQPSALSLGMINGGDGPNRVATRCRLEGTLRAVSWAEQDAAEAAIRVTADDVATATGAAVSVSITHGIRPPVRNAAGSARRVENACRQLGVTCLDYPEQPVGVSEDFGWYAERWPGTIFFLGCAKADKVPGLHEGTFDLDESALLPAVRIFHALACGTSTT